MGHTLGDASIVIALSVVWVAYLYFKHTERKRRLEIIHQERLAAMDKGIPLPELPLDPAKLPKGPDPKAMLLHGIAWTAMGLGGVIALFVVGPLPNGVTVWPLALPLLFLGAGLMLYYVLVSDRRADQARAANQPDERLVERCRETGDEAAFAELVGRYQRPVFRIAVSILGQGCVQEAEDVAQDVMLRVHHALRTFRGESTFSTWIYRIAFNQALNVKARMRHRAPHVGEDALAATPSAERGPDDRLQAEQRKRAVLACVHELPEVYQSALRLHYWMGESVASVAEMLDAPENTIKSYLFRSRQLLHAMLTKRGFDAR